jgi:hypothetical protein
MDAAGLVELQKDHVLRRRLAKVMALRCFRNTILEEFHVGTFPHSQSGEYSDVKVVSPGGEIAWHDLARLSDGEMRELMIDVVDHCYAFLNDLFNTPNGERLIEMLQRRDELPQWNDPDLSRTQSF